MAEHTGIKAGSQKRSTAIQLALWEILQPDGKKCDTNAVGLYDQAPRFVFSGAKRASHSSARGGGSDPVAVRASSNKRLVKREFDFGDETCSVTIRPVVIERRGADGNMDEVEVYPGDREQIVEEVIRKIATEQARLSVTDKQKIGMHFSLYEVLAELSRVGHTLNITELKEALKILHLSSVEIKNAKGEDEGNFSSFPVLLLSSRKRGEGRAAERAYLEFNPLVHRAIQTLQFHRLDYDCLVRIDNPVSRWLYKRLAWHLFTGGENLAISATHIIRNAGITEWSRRRAMLDWITGACESLIEKGVLAAVEKETLKEGKAKVDIDYVLVPSERFMRQMRQARSFQESNAAEFQAIVGGDGKRAELVPIGQEEVANIRRRRRSAASPALVPTLVLKQASA